MSNERVIKIGEKHFAIGLEWQEINGGNKWTIKRNLTTLISNDNGSYASLTTVIHNKTSQFVTFDKSSLSNFKDKDLYPAASVLAEEVKGHIFIKKIESDNVNENLFWTLSVDENGLIIEGEDKIIDGYEELEDKVSLMSDLTGLKVAVYADSKDELESLFQIDKIINIASFDFFDEYEYIKVKLYKKKDTKALKIFLGSSFAIGLSLSGYIYFQDDSKYQEIVGGDIIAPLNVYKSKIAEYKKYLALNKKKKTISQNDYLELAKTQILDTFESQFYTNKDIINNIIYLDQILPLYSVEWKLEKYAYTKNQFIIIYNKIPSSIGVYSHLDDEISKISNKNSIDIKPVSLESNGTKRIYIASFDDNGRSEKFFERKELEKNVITKNEILKPLEKEIKKINNSILSISRKVTNIGVFEKSFTSSVDEFYDDISKKKIVLSNKYKEAISIIEKKKDPIIVNYDYMDGDIMEHIELSQVLTEYKWNYPTNPKTYPILKNAKAEKGESLIPYAKSYDIEVFPIEGLTNTFGSLYDVATALNSKNIIFKVVEYETEDNMWTINADFFEKF